MDQGSKKTVLVVDDSVDYLVGVSILLEHSGFTVTATSGKEALAKLQHWVPGLWRDNLREMRATNKMRRYVAAS